MKRSTAFIIPALILFSGVCALVFFSSFKEIPPKKPPEFEEKTANEIEQKIIAMYSKGTSTRDIQDLLEELYGIAVSASTISKITDKAWELVEGWHESGSCSSTN